MGCKIKKLSEFKKEKCKDNYLSFRKLLGLNLFLCQSKAYSTGIMPPDLGWFGNFIVYLGIPSLLIIIGLVLIWVITKWLTKPVLRSNELVDEQVMSNFTMIKDKFVQTLNISFTIIKNNRLLKWFVVFVIPYLLILIYALNVLKNQNSPFNNLVLFEVLVVYALIYLLPLIVIKYLLKIRADSQSHDNTEK